MKIYILPVALQILGVLVIVAEIFIPSLGVLMAIALGLFGYSLYLVFTTISSFAGMVFLGLDLLAVPLLLILGMKILAVSPLSLKNRLSSKAGVVTGNHQNYMGSQGICVTDLRPSGIALIGEKRLDVVTDGDYIEANTPVIVTRVTGNQIIVEQERSQAEKSVNKK
ncbi:MAG: serine protease [Proteobacteria bacterium]|nr:serine protease [Pseudomonadota bacterium]